MERENKKVISIYILVGIIIFLIIYLVIYALKNYSLENEVPETENKSKYPDVGASCTFNMTTDQFNNIEANTSLCDNLNKITITDASNVVVYYSPINGQDTGIYMNDNKIANKADKANIHRMVNLDNKLFMSTITANEADLDVYSDGVNIYNLKNELNELQIVDPTFISINTIDNTVGTTLSSTNIDGSSFMVNNEGITFNSKVGKDCTAFGVSGSSYIVKYSANTFAAPEVTGNISCGRTF